MKVSCVLRQITKMLDNSNHLHQVNTHEVCLSAPLLVFGPCRCLSQRRLQEGLATHPVHPSLQSGPLLLLLLKKWKDLMRNVENIQLSFNIFTWLQRTPHTWGRAVVTQGQLPVCQHLIKQHSRFFWLCSCNLHPEITWGLQGEELSALTSLSKSSRVASPGLRPKVPFSIARFPQISPKYFPQRPAQCNLASLAIGENLEIINLQAHIGRRKT